MSSSNSSPQSPQPPPTPLSPVAESFSIRTISGGDKEAVLQHLRRFFFRDEPLNVNIQLLEHPDSKCLELEEYSVKCIKDGLSLLAMTQSGEVVGVCINTLDSRADTSTDEPEEECPNEKFGRILGLLDTVDREAHVFKQFPDVDNLINVKILSVDTNWRGKGIAKQLMDRTRDLGRERGYGLMRVDCTSEFSARAVARLNFKCIYTLQYAEYKDEEGDRPIFNPEPPHTCVRVYVDRITPLEDE